MNVNEMTIALKIKLRYPTLKYCPKAAGITSGIIVAHEEARVRPDMEKHSGFDTPLGIRGSRLGTMGGCNMPGYFQHVMNITAGVYLGINIFPYLDILIVATKGTLREHLKIVCWLIERLRQGEWFIGEIELAAEEVEILGFLFN